MASESPTVASGPVSAKFMPVVTLGHIMNEFIGVLSKFYS